MLLYLVTVIIVFVKPAPNIIDNFPVESTNKIFQYDDDQKYGNFNGPNAIRTRDPRHVKAVS